MNQKEIANIAITRKCSLHSDYQAQQICLDSECADNIFLCELCAQVGHLSHDVIIFSPNEDQNIGAILTQQFGKYQIYNKHLKLLTNDRIRLENSLKKCFNEIDSFAIQNYQKLSLQIVALETVFYFQWRLKLVTIILSPQFTDLQACISAKIIKFLINHSNIQLLQVVTFSKNQNKQLLDFFGIIQSELKQYVSKINHQINKNISYEEHKQNYFNNQQVALYNQFISQEKQQNLYEFMIKLLEFTQQINQRYIEIVKQKKQTIEQEKRSCFNKNHFCKIEFICIDKKCIGKNLYCSQCRSNHQGHQIIQFQEQLLVNLANKSSLSIHFINHQDASALAPQIALLKQELIRLARHLRQIKQPFKDVPSILYAPTMLFQQKVIKSVSEIIRDQTKQFYNSITLIKNNRLKFHKAQTLKEAISSTQYSSYAMQDIIARFLNSVMTANKKFVLNLQKFYKDKNTLNQAKILERSLQEKRKSLIYQKISKETIDYRKIKDLKIIDLSAWNIVKIQHLNNLQNLVELNLNWNEVQKIPKIENLNLLQILYLDNNYITKIENLQYLKSLIIVHLGFNQIQKIENLSKLKKLKQLHLDNNQISKLQNLDNLESLEYLQLDNNKIQVVQNLENLKSLKRLWLANNQIIQIVQFPQLKNLTEYFIQNNPISIQKKQNLNSFIKSMEGSKIFFDIKK